MNYTHTHILYQMSHCSSLFIPQRTSLHQRSCLVNFVCIERTTKMTYAKGCGKNESFGMSTCFRREKKKSKFTPMKVNMLRPLMRRFRGYSSKLQEARLLNLDRSAIYVLWGIPVDIEKTTDFGAFEAVKNHRLLTVLLNKYSICICETASHDLNPVYFISN